MVSPIDPIQYWQQRLSSKNLIGKKLNRRLAGIKLLLENELPVILGFEDLAASLKLKNYSLGQLVNSAESFYREFYIPKKRGGIRTIQAPYPVLLETQRWILTNILEKIPVSDSAHGFVKGRSIVSHASKHVSNGCLLKVDIASFFPSITEEQVYFLFNKLGYSSSVAFLLSRLCTLNKRLPQGAASSPTISNILFKDVDIKVEELTAKHGLVYSRYADDLAFSTDMDFSDSFLDELRNILNSNGYEINAKKTQLKKQKARKIVTGVEISGGKVTLPRETKRRLKQELYFIKKFGVLNHMEKTNRFDPIYLERVLGKLSFWRQVDPTSHFAIKATEDINILRMKFSE